MYYAHTEGDGTVHYFAKDDKGEWKDELGLGQKLTFAGGDSEARYTITDKSGTKLCFAEKTGLLTKITDANGNTQRITWSGGKVTKVTDPASRAVTLGYDSSGHLVTVKTPSGQEKKFAYDSSGHLTGITDADGAQSTYTYDGNHMLKSITDPYGYRLYVNWVRPEAYGAWRVSAVLEKAGGEEGMRLGLDYGYNRTKFTDEKGRSQYYLFDNSGHTVSVRDDNGYGAAWEFASRKVSRLSAASDLQFTPVQRLKGTFDGLKGWNGYGSSSAVKVDEETDDNIVFVNKKCIRFISSDASAYGTVVQTVMLPAGRTYVFSVYGRAAVTGLGEKPSFWLQAQKEDQTEIARHTENIRGNRGWKRMQLVFKIPSGSAPVKTRIVVRAVDMKGTMWLDGFQLEEGEAASRFNLMTNVDLSGGLDGFKKAGNAGDLDRVVTLSVDSGMYPPSKSGLGRNVFMAVGGPSENKRLVYELDISGNAGDCYMASAWGRGQSVPRTVPETDKDRKDRHFGLCINFYDGEAAAAGKNGNNYQYLEFGADTDSWQYLNGAAVAKQKYTKIQVMYLYNRNANRAYFTGLSFFKERYGTTFVYDDEGNIVKATDKAKKTSSFEYDSAGNIVKMIDVKGNSFKYTYDDKHNVTGAVSAMNVKYAFTYSSNGNVETAKIVDPSNTDMAITATAEYTKDGNYMSKLCDEDGNSTSYRWDTAKGFMTAVVDGAGNETKYAYDDCGRVNKVSASVGTDAGGQQVSVTYAYKNDRMTQIRHNGFNYDISYDSFGKETEVKIAGTQVVGHIYNDRNGLLRQTDYANGISVRYTYDYLDRLQKMEVLRNKEIVYSYKLIYDRNGQVRRKEVGGDQTCIWTYDYDLIGRLGTAVSNQGEQRTYQYDANGNVSGIKRICAGTTQTTTYTFDKDDREVSLKDDSAVISRTYDIYGRRSVSDRGNGVFKTTYKYAANAEKQSVNRVEAVENKGKAIRYTYDNNGNVKTIHDEAGTTIYQYDTLQRLLREDNARLKKTIIYDRDGGGNVTQKKIYPFNTGDVSGSQPEKTIIYTYASGWKDQMIMADGQEICYDASGNMTEYQGNQYSWCGNGILTDVVKADGSKIHYAINAEGVRTQKKVNGKITDTYYVDGDQIFGEKNSNGYQGYIYNSDGELEAIRYNKKVYYYIKNGQDDVIGLCDASGQQVVDYSYDTWGNLLKTGGSMAGTLGKDNPFRYRGYYYDEETGLYYLNSRYYHPGLGRMMSADCLYVLGMSKTTLNDKNLYNYCDGNPVGRRDESGRLPMAVLIQGAIGGVIGCVSGMMAAGAVAEIEGRTVTAKELAVSAATGFFSGAATSMIKSDGISFVANIVITGAVTAYVTDGSAKEKLDAALNDMAKAAVTSVAFGIKLPFLEKMGNNILSTSLGATYDMAVAKTNTNGARNAPTTSSKGGYSGKWLVSTETIYHNSGRVCIEVRKSYYSDGSISVERRKYTV